MMIRGRSTRNPVLLFLAGGPGGTELGAMRRHGQSLEDDFVVVTWDQRGTGKSYDQLDPTSTLTLDGAVADTLEVTNYLRDRFGQDKIYLVGQSWGTILGVLAVQRQPELYRPTSASGRWSAPRRPTRPSTATPCLGPGERQQRPRGHADPQRPAAVRGHARLRAGADQRAGGLPLRHAATPKVRGR